MLIRVRAKPCRSSVLWVMGGTRTTDDRTPRAAKPSTAFSRVGSAARAARVLLGARPAQARDRERARRPDQRLAGSRERVAEGVQDGEVGGDRGGPVAGAHPVVVEREVDHAVGIRGRLGQPVEVIKVTAVHGGAERGHGRGGLIGPREAGDVVSGGNEFGDDGRTEMAGRTGNEDPHERLPGCG